MAEKRKRGQNFVSEEKDKLVKLLALHTDTILNKKTDGSTNEAKTKAWIDVTNAFNSSATVYRTKDSLMKLWEKLKSESKLYYQATKKSTTATGGGPSEVKYDPILEQVCALLGRACTGIIGVHDCDAENIINEKPKKIRLTESEGPINGSNSPGCSQAMDNVTIEFIEQKDDTKENEENQTMPTDSEEIVNISKTPLWSRRRPQLSQINERTEAVTSLCSSFTIVNKKKENIEDLKKQLLEDEIIFKRKLYELQLQAAAKEVEIKDLLINQIKGGAINWKTLFGNTSKDQ